ncbi:hypothetical protein EHI8A_003750 [Entamoeba histolytica HM-1:IMSS-B]|uniref:EF-hand domain-containing protein n=6 Tax=Entamoeba histolytica TaxID=5759 RepID=C4LV47_ENTH1|nr:hypothetical protein EHI_182660 [Entamoeba histolytica HM-1:IMSS]EMD45050.1 Hypothetical protein EHI5A_001530 [Entamoeba histolytica KU27]EMH72313.1 hypothetical protein EHI8A_003750 [Entamoeba histolytica HM-1:IMSS-B]EMS10737.1 hypothetical protein KM1_002670 [Entamoeba histolytica HM-3:IMSS]ENY63610.1 hypothetical protein EHI7A_003590 [Entamoeba histolytica HM-1:IMSS-A]GAT92528.1 hypothetical protein CL6EHI_182660 [Entamoeba histolytica]|eukprot:XP_649105.1 hypothetical protein EHI_182660 [Entamoeba histolytica HM-1:IMSS]
MEFGQTILPIQPLRLEQPDIITEEESNDKDVVFRSFDSNKTNKLTKQEKDEILIKEITMKRKDKNSEKKPKKKQKTTIKSSLESCGVLKNYNMPLTQDNISNINHIFPVNKYIRIRQWINLNNKDCLYPYPFLSM